jgi:flagellar basal-body rod protein FlgG
LNTSLFISSGALQAYQQKIDTTANNVANVNTTGYKRKDHTFSEILASQINNQGRGNEGPGRLTPNGLRVGYGTKAGLTQLNMTQGQAMETGKPFDLMIAGNGFFQIGNDANDEVSYTRDGNFHLSPNPNNEGNYHLVHANGGFLLDQNGNPIELDADYEVKIESNGQLQLKAKDGQGEAFLADQRVGIVDIQNPHILRNTGDNQFAIDPEALPEGDNPADFVRMMVAGEAELSSGFLEGSNVDLMKEMTELMTSQRSYQLNARAISYADQMVGIANNILK